MKCEEYPSVRSAGLQRSDLTQVQLWVRESSREGGMRAKLEKRGRASVGA